MTNKELIEILKTLDPDAKVVKMTINGSLVGFNDIEAVDQRTLWINKETNFQAVVFQ